MLHSKVPFLDKHAHFSIQLIDLFSDLCPIFPPRILCYIKCQFNLFEGLVHTQLIHINPYRLVHLPVILGTADLMGSPLLVLYFWFTSFHPSDFKEFSGTFSVSDVAALSMDTVGFSMISSCSVLWNNQLIVSISHVTFKRMLNPLPLTSPVYR